MPSRADWEASTPRCQHLRTMAVQVGRHTNFGLAGGMLAEPSCEVICLQPLRYQPDNTWRCDCGAVRRGAR